MNNIQTWPASTANKYLLFICLILLSVWPDPLAAQKKEVVSDHRNIYAVVRADVNPAMLSMIKQSLSKEGFDVEFTQVKYNAKSLLTNIRMVVKQGNSTIGDVTSTNEPSDKPLVFYFINGKTIGLSQGYPKGLPSTDRRKLEGLNGFMVTNGSQLEIHGKYKSEDLEVNGTYKSEN